MSNIHLISLNNGDEILYKLVDQQTFEWILSPYAGEEDILPQHIIDKRKSQNFYFGNLSLEVDIKNYVHERASYATGFEFDTPQDVQNHITYNNLNILPEQFCVISPELIKTPQI